MVSRPQSPVPNPQSPTSELWQRYAADRSDTTVRNQLIEAYLPLVRRTAKSIYRHLPWHVDFDDVVASGVKGLIDSIERFDLSRGLRFETFAPPRIRGAMLDELRRGDWVPRLVRANAKKLENGRRAAEIRLGRSPNENETREQLGMNTEEFSKLTRDARVAAQISLRPRPPEHALADQRQYLESIDLGRETDPAERVKRIDFLRIVTRDLSRSERLLIILYYFEGLTMREIGATLGLSESRVSQMHGALLFRLKDQLRDRSEFPA